MSFKNIKYNLETDYGALECKCVGRSGEKNQVYSVVVRYIWKTTMNVGWMWSVKEQRWRKWICTTVLKEAAPNVLMPSGWKHAFAGNRGCVLLAYLPTVQSPHQNSGCRMTELTSRLPTRWKHRSQARWWKRHAGAKALFPWHQIRFREICKNLQQIA